MSSSPPDPPGSLPPDRELATRADTLAWGRALAGCLRAGDVVVLTGPLGAGKTTLVRGLAEGLGVRGPITSPTFVIARVHPGLTGGAALVHVDAYRLRDALELEDLGLEADLQDAVTVVEWGAGVAAALGDSYLEVVLERGEPIGGAQRPDPDDGEHSEGSAGPRRVRTRGRGPRWSPSAAQGEQRLP